jgi:hypothetical protein
MPRAGWRLGEFADRSDETSASLLGRTSSADDRLIHSAEIHSVAGDFRLWHLSEEPIRIAKVGSVT